jgi:hypothetical protein
MEEKNTPEQLMEELALKIVGMRQHIGIGMPIDPNIFVKVSFTCDLIALYVLRQLTHEKWNAARGEEPVKEGLEE